MFSLHLCAVPDQSLRADCSLFIVDSTQTAAAEFPLIFQDDDYANYSNLCLHWQGPRTPETDLERSWSGAEINSTL